MAAQTGNTISPASTGLLPDGLLPHTKNKPKKETLQPIISLVSTLPKTTYKEQNEPKGTNRTLAYIRVQRSLLSWLAMHAADALTPLQARKWTEAIEPRTLKPKVQDALRLCYYMRSQSFDTYARINDGYISLYVVNQSSHIRDPKHDHLYWKQSYKTNYVEYMALSNAPRASRRNAMAPDSYNQFFMVDGMPTMTRVPLQSVTGDVRMELEAMGLDLNALPSPSTIANQGQRIAAANRADANEDAEGLNALREATERNLDRLLMEGAQDTNAIQAALAQIEEIDQQLQ